jgi:hypothetical protein
VRSGSPTESRTTWDFTVTGPGQLLASGHPGQGQGGSSSVGLIESKDAGQTWRTRSLSGEADFHALEYLHDRVYRLSSMTGQFHPASCTIDHWERPDV